MASLATGIGAANSKHMDNITVLGYIAGVLTTASFIPQLLKAYKTKSTKDISVVMYTWFIIGIALWILYGIYKNSWPVILANAVTMVIALGILALKLRYH